MRVFNGVKLFDPPEHAWYGKPGEKFDVVLASDYAASMDRLTSDKARLAAELAAEQESNTYLNNLHTLDADRIQALEAALRNLNDIVKSMRNPQTLADVGLLLWKFNGPVFVADQLLGSASETKGEQHGT